MKTNKIFIYVSLIIMLFTKMTNSIFFILDPYEQRCISRDMKEATYFSGVYFISGEQENENKAMIKDGDNHVIWQAVGQKTSKFNYVIVKSGVYTLCIETTLNVQLTVSFEFFDEKKDEQLISVQNIENLSTVIHTVRRKLDIIHSNMRNSAVRRGTHLNISNAINSKITFYTALKVIFLVLFSIFQILMLTSIFGNVKVCSKISVMEPKSAHGQTRVNINSTEESSVFL